MLHGARARIATRETATLLRSEPDNRVSQQGLPLGTLIRAQPQDLRAKVRDVQLPLHTVCACAKLFNTFDIPKGPQQKHAVLRNAEQWEAFHTEPQVYRQNARHSTLPSEHQLTQAMCKFEESIHPILQTKCPVDTHDLPTHTTFSCTESRARALVEWSGVEWSGGQQHVRDSILFAKEFDIAGVSDSAWQCQALAMRQISQCADRHRILQRGEELQALNASLQILQYRAVFIAKHCIPVALRDTMPFPDLLKAAPPKRRHAPPSIFPVPKWKLQEMINFFAWRNIISFAFHPVKPLAKIVGRCLTLMVLKSIPCTPI